MNINIRMKPSTDEEGQPIFEAFAYTDGCGAKGSGRTQGGALRNLIAKLKVMHKFSRIARSVLETKIGFHQCNINFKIEQNQKTKDDN